MRLYSVEGNSQKLDGGAMFGNAPRAVWSRWCPPDERNRITLACRALLIEDQEKLILCETGIGAFFEPAMKERFGVVESHHRLLESLAGLGISDADITHVVLSHLHFDHAGGVLSAWQEGEPLRLLFPKARFLVGSRAWERALRPHVRDKASFIPELPGLLTQSGRLELVEGGTSSLGGGYQLHLSEGHTPGLMLLQARGALGDVTFLGDLVPGVPWVHLPITMGYDRYPELLIDEKTRLLSDMAARGGWGFFTHDVHCAMARPTWRDGKMAADSPQAELRGWEL